MGLMDLSFGADVGSVTITDLDWEQTRTWVPTAEIERLRCVERDAKAHIAAAQSKREYWKQRAADLDERLRSRPRQRRSHRPRSGSARMARRERDGCAAHRWRIPGRD
jgi:hypothetical protein